MFFDTETLIRTPEVIDYCINILVPLVFMGQFTAWGYSAA